MKEFVAYTDGSYDMETHYGASGVVVLDKSETRSVELSVIGGGIAVVTCRFKTDVSSGTSGGGS